MANPAISPGKIGASTPPKAAPDPDVTAVKQLLRLLDKASKSNRTYGAANPVAQKFFKQFFDQLSEYLASHHTLGFLVQRFQLHFKGEVVYQADQQAENLAFKLYSDGIRELSIHENLAEEELAFFLEALWGNQQGDASDDDIVTRLWERNLTTITFVTAEEIMQASGPDSASGFGGVLAAQESGTLNSPVGSLPNVLTSERARLAQGGGQLGGLGLGTGFQEGAGLSAGAEPGQGGASGKPGTTGVIGFEVSAQDMETLAKEIEAESARDNTRYVLDMLTAILSCETNTELLTRTLEVFGEVLTTLTKEGEWKVLNAVIGLLHEAQEIRPELSDDHRKQLSTLFDALGHPERMKDIEACLNQNPEASTEGLLEFFLQIRHHPVSSLCLLLSNLETAHHRAIVSEALMSLGKDNPDPLIRGLADRRDQYVQDLLAIIGKLNDSRFVEPLEKLVQHPNAQIRKEVLRTVGALHPTGDGRTFVVFIHDSEASIRQAALRHLSNNQYKTVFEDWAPILTEKEFLERPVVEKRGIFQVMAKTAGEDCVPYWQQLITERFWFNRKKKEELAALAVAALSKVDATSAASALEAGAQRGNRAIRQACSTVLADLEKRRSVNRE